MYKKITLILILCLAVFFAYFNYRGHKVKEEFNNVHLGTHKNQIVGELGSPPNASDCPKFDLDGFSGKDRMACRQVLSYNIGIAHQVEFYFDEQDKLIWKTEVFSP